MSVLKSQKRESDPLELELCRDGYEPYGSWELNSASRGQQIALLTAEPCHQPLPNHLGFPATVLGLMNQTHNSSIVWFEQIAASSSVKRGSQAMSGS